MPETRGLYDKVCDKLHLLNSLAGNLQETRVRNHNGEAPCTPQARTGQSGYDLAGGVILLCQ